MHRINVTTIEALMIWQKIARWTTNSAFLWLANIHAIQLATSSHLGK